MPDTPRRRRASRDVALSTTFLLLAGGLAACGNDDDNAYQEVCINPETQERVDDDYCDDDFDGGYLGYTPIPYYFSPGYGGRYPGVGSRVSGGSENLPNGRNASVRRGNVSASGGSSSTAIKSRGGGFGGSAKSSS